MGRLPKFFLLGAASTLIDYTVFALLISLGIDYVVAIILGYSAGLLANYHLGRSYIFVDGTKMTSSHAEFIAVSAIALVGGLLNIVIVKLLSFSLGQMDPMLSRVVAVGIVFFWNYFARKRFIYH